jgi:hypothetical protein
MREDIMLPPRDPERIVRHPEQNALTFPRADRLAMAKHAISERGGVVHHFQPIVRRRAFLDVLQADPVSIPVVGGQ